MVIGDKSLAIEETFGTFEREIFLSPETFY